MADALDDLAERWPGLDMAKLRILREVDRKPGGFMCDIADALHLPHQHVQFHVTTMATGKKGRPSAGLGLVRLEDHLLDRRYREVYLTRAGRHVIRHIRPLLDQQ